MGYLKLLIVGFVLFFHSFFAQANGCFPFPNRGTHPQNNHRVQSYQTRFQQCSLEGQLVYSIRSFKLNGTAVNLVVDARNLSSEIVASSCMSSCENMNDNAFLRTPYGRLLSESGSSPFPLQNDGIIQGNGRKIALTIDMCPSSRGFSQDVYNALAARAQSKGRAIPVGVAMTRGWLQRWGRHFNRIKDYQARGILSVEWINHSSTHPYRRGVSLENNFLLSSGVDIVDEVLGNEVSMIQAGITPASFFRFPGLVSNRSTIDYVTNQGLVTLGSDAWLAKNEAPSFGSIILIHGNKNEPVGETKLLQYMRTMDTHGHQFGHLNEAL